jgi:hypothetical protein
MLKTDRITPNARLAADRGLPLKPGVQLLKNVQMQNAQEAKANRLGFILQSYSLAHYPATSNIL